MKAPGRLQRMGIGLILIGAYGAVGLNVYWRGKPDYETPLWYPEPIRSDNRSKGERPFRRPYFRNEFPKGPRRAVDTNQIWVQRPKMHFPKNAVGLNAVDSVELARYPASFSQRTTAVVRIFRTGPVAFHSAYLAGGLGTGLPTAAPGLESFAGTRIGRPSIGRLGTCAGTG